MIHGKPPVGKHSPFEPLETPAVPKAVAAYAVLGIYPKLRHPLSGLQVYCHPHCRTYINAQLGTLCLARLT